MKTINCEIITIGSELLLGQIEDTNSTYLAVQMALAGVAVSRRTTVGDRLPEIVEAIRQAVSRCDLVITTGGLGPTMDDLTREAVARVAGVELEFRPDLMEEISAFFQKAGYAMPENNRRQAWVPFKGRAVTNPAGTAPAFIKEIGETPVVCLPGVPRELKYLFENEILSFIRQRFDLHDQQVIYRVLKAAGVGESKVDRIIGDLIKPGRNPEVGLLASLGEIRIRIAAHAPNQRAADRMIEPVEQEIRSRLGTKIYGRDADTLEGVIDAYLTQAGFDLAILETFSGGLAAQRMHRLPSGKLLQSLVIPDREHLVEWLGIQNHGWDGKKALQIAERFRGLSRSGMVLVILGFQAGGSNDKPFQGVAVAAGREIAKDFAWEMGGDLHNLQHRGAVIGLNTLRLTLMEHLFPRSS